MAGRLRELSWAPFVRRLIPFTRVLPLCPDPFPRSPPCNIINYRLGLNIIYTVVQANPLNHLYFSPTEVFTETFFLRRSCNWFCKKQTLYSHQLQVYILTSSLVKEAHNCKRMKGFYECKLSSIVKCHCIYWHVRYFILKWLLGKCTV